MSRSIGATNLAHVEGAHVTPVVLVALEYDTPVYVHSGIGPIVYDGNTYLGVGAFGSIDPVEETEAIAPAPLTLTLSDIDDATITEALNSGNYGDRITIYHGYRNDTGALIADPWVMASGFYEFPTLQIGTKNEVAITMQHDLIRLQEKSGRRYTDEDQQNEFPGDDGFVYVSEMPTVKLLWGGFTVGLHGQERPGRDNREPAR